MVNAKINSKKVFKILLIFIIIAVFFSFAIIGIVYLARGNVISADENYLLSLKNDSIPNNADVRIMSSNLLVHYKSWGGKPVKPRGDKYIKMIETYKPDVIGLQEMSEEWFAVLNQNLPSNYKILDSADCFFNTYLTAMVYNADTLELLEKDNFAYKNKENPRLRRVVFAKFKNKKTGKIFAVTNTHLSLLFANKEEEFKLVMDSQAEELVSYINGVDCPVIAVGDFNTREEKYISNPRKDDYPKIYNYLSSNLMDAKKTAKNKLCASELEYNNSLYDHIFYKGNLTVDTFNILAYSYLLELSDHYPIYADFSIL